MKPSLQLKQDIQLSLTPQLQQAIYLLQLSSVELQHEIQHYLESNPLLEVVDLDYPSTHEEPLTQQELTQGNEESFETLDLSTHSDSAPDFDENHWETSYNAEENLPNYHFNNEFNLEQNAAELDLKQELLWQIDTLNLSDAEHLAAYFIIDSLKSNGFLAQTAKEIFAELHNKVAINSTQFENLRNRIQQLDPAGCACEDLREFLLLQLSSAAQNTPYRNDAIYLLRRHEHLLAKHDYTLLKKRSRFSDERLKNALSLIQNLYSEPYNSFSEAQIEYITPDLYVTKRQNTWQVQLNHSNQIQLKINPDYEILAHKTTQAQEQQYLQSNLQEARWLIRSLKNRDETLLKVANKIIELQQDFLEQGEIAMKPLTLAQIADAIGMHESTVSRATTGKYIHTPRGVLELKFFFSSQINTNEGDDCSSTAIRAMIKSMVNEENTKKPLSDNKITQLLEQQGIQIARRTVAKYREEMAIPPSSKRKRLN